MRVGKGMWGTGGSWENHTDMCMTIYLVAGVAIAEHQTFVVRLFGEGTFEDMLWLEGWGGGHGGESEENECEEKFRKIHLT
jgi:hypothetical protein